MKVERETRAQVPMLHLAAVACFGQGSVSPELMGAMAEAGIHVAFFSTTGRFLARVEGIPGGNVLLRRQQYRVADDDARSFAIARAADLRPGAHRARQRPHRRERSSG
jgi:CRISP-associated protein Cas1